MNRTLLLFCFVCCTFMSTNLFAQDTIKYTQTCYASQTTLVALPSLPVSSVDSLQWDLDNDGMYNDAYGDTIVHFFVAVGSFPVEVRIVPVTGPAYFVSNTVTIDPLPQVNFMANNLCESKAAVYISQSTITSGSINQYLWDFNNDNITDDNSSGDTALYTCGPAQVYITKLICVSDKGCSAFTQKNTTVYPNPTAAFSAVNACVNANASFTNTSTVSNLDFYLWNFGDGNSNATTGNAAHAYTAAGAYTVNLIAVSMEGCRDTATSSITINPLPVVSITPSGSTVFCAGSNVMLDAGSGFPSYLWSNSSNQQSITVSSSGNYNVIVTDASGCSNMTSTSVTVNALPIVSITASDTVLHPGSSMILIANGASSYSWSTGNYSNNITVTQSGTYSVMGIDANGCTASDSIVVMNENPDQIYVSSSIMTPNGDGINEYLVIERIGDYTSCDLKVYNMWNDEVFSVSGYKNDWAGYGNNGKQVPDGPYYYIISCDDKPVLKGNINIILR